MEPAEWLRLLVTVIVTLSGAGLWLRRDLKEWAKEIFAKKAEMVRLEERLDALDARIQRIDAHTEKILEAVTTHPTS